MIDMLRALTIRQPWCSAVVDGHKSPENRAQGFPKGYRGPLLIHAGAAWSERGALDDRMRSVYPVKLARGADHRAGFEMAAVLGMVDVVDIHPAAMGCCAPWGEESYPPANSEARPPGIVTHLLFERALRFAPIPARGALGLWRPDDDLRIEAAHRLAELVTWDLEAARRLAERGDVEQLWHVCQDDAA